MWLEGYALFFLFLLKTYIVGTRKNRHSEAVLTSTQNLCFEQKYEKYSKFVSENFHFWWNFQYIWIGMFS